MLSNDKVLDVIDKIDMWVDEDKIYRNPNYKNTAIAADISDNGKFWKIAIVTSNDTEDYQYSVRLVTPNSIENSYKLSPNSDKYIPFNSQITEDIIRALYEENNLIYNSNDMNKLFTSNDHKNIIISAFPEDKLKWCIDSFLTYDPESQTYQEFDVNINGNEDCGEFYEPDEEDEGIMTEDEYYYWIENMKR